MSYETRLAWDNLVLDTSYTLSASSAASSRPVSYLTSPARWKKWRSNTDTGDQWVKIDMGSAQPFQVVMLVGWKAHTGGSIRVQANATDSWGAPSVDEVLTLASPNPTGIVGHWFSASQSFRWARVFFSNDGAANDYVELGVWMMAPYDELPISGVSSGAILRGFDLYRVDPSHVVSSLDGQESVHDRTKYFEARGLAIIDGAATRALVEAAFESVGSGHPAVLTADPDNVNETLYGRFTTPLRMHEHVGRALTWEMPFVFREVR